MIPVAFIAGGIALFAVIFFVGRHFEKKRTESLEGTAQELGLFFLQDGSSETVEIQSAFSLFQQGRRRLSKNLIYGDAGGTGVWIFDYQYTTGSGKHQHTHRQTVMAFRSEELALPQFDLYAEGFWSRFGSKVFGMQDIDFDSHPEFSATFVLKGESEPMIRELFTESLLSFFEGHDKTLQVSGKGQWLILYRPGRPVKPEQIQAFFREGFVVYREFLANGGMSSAPIRSEQSTADMDQYDDEADFEA